MNLKVEFAVYGALVSSNEDKSRAAIVTDKLQAAINRGDGVVRINNDTLGPDPAKGTTKHFGAIVTVEGRSLAFACQEDQTIDFKHHLP